MANDVVGRQRIEDASTFISVGRLFYGADRAGIIHDYGEVHELTQLSIAAICNLESAVRHVLDNDLVGSFVECGTWRGGSLSYWARSYLRNGGNTSDCHLYGFDSFQGMPHLTEEDGDSGSQWLHGRPISEVDTALKDGRLIPLNKNVASEEECRKVVRASGYSEEHVTISRGWFQDTLPRYKDEIGPISVLHLDADLYLATKYCLDTLYANVQVGGIIILDDYGCFEGCRQAVHEFANRRGITVNLAYVDYSCRFFFKV